MKRDMELVRSLLLEIEEQPPGEYWLKPSIEGHEDKTVYYHLELMRDASLVEATLFDTQNDGLVGAIVQRLTWDGHELLDAARNEGIWQKAKDKMFEFGGSMPLDVLKAVLMDLAKRQLLGP